MSQTGNRLLNILSVIAVLLLIATVIRTLVYWFIGIDNERIFRTELFLIWGIAMAVLIIRQFKK